LASTDESTWSQNPEEHHDNPHRRENLKSHILKQFPVFRYFGSGCTFTELHYAFRRKMSTVGNIVREVCVGFIWNSLRESCLLKPNEQTWLDTANNFEKNVNFPHCVVSFDGQHIRIIKLSCSDSL
jgi:hypothetical protein